MSCLVVNPDKETMYGKYENKSDDETNIVVSDEEMLIPEIKNEDNEIDLSMRFVSFMFFNIFFDLVYLLITNQMFLFYLTLIPSFFQFNTTKFNAVTLFMYNSFLFTNNIVNTYIHVYLKEVLFSIFDVIYMIVKVSYIYSLYSMINIIL